MSFWNLAFTERWKKNADGIQACQKQKIVHKIPRTLTKNDISTCTVSKSVMKVYFLNKGYFVANKLFETTEEDN